MVPQVADIQTPIVLDGLACRGNEDSLAQCAHEMSVEYCSHSHDAGAFCTHLIGITIANKLIKFNNDIILLQNAMIQI